MNVSHRTSCPCVINPAEKSPELEEIKRINREYQVKAKSSFNPLNVKKQNRVPSFTPPIVFFFHPG